MKTFAKQKFVSLLIDGCCECLRIGALGDFCTITRYLVLYSADCEDDPSLFQSDRVRHFCFSNDAGTLTIGGIKVPSLNARFDRPTWTVPSFLRDLRLIIESTLDDSISSLILTELSSADRVTLLEDELTRVLKDLRAQDPDKHSMLLTFIMMCIVSETDSDQLDAIRDQNGTEFFFNDASTDEQGNS
jgi:hypothetical protein